MDRREVKDEGKEEVEERKDGEDRIDLKEEEVVVEASWWIERSRIGK